MKKNVGSADKAVRIVFGLAIIGIGIFMKSWWGLIGLIPLATAASGFCPAYTMTGIKTCKTAPAQDPEKTEVA